MIRTLIVATLLLAGCSPADAPSPTPRSTTPSDVRAASACDRALRSTTEKVPALSDISAASQAVGSTDPGVQEAGRLLGLAAKEAGDLWVANDPTVDQGPANLRLTDARQGLLTECTRLFGTPPWPFTRTPAPTPSR
ncbi:hypothetical protein O7634_28335 [Micromonospora sp. WMMD1120]|uniref:hypothetical protein n=1 Tax=Micromonospora sp. WMMD1120 TaxID=3016106 RepID=UPI0024168B16|nr:hypothetical protein [Micromonospora sp. WMMD1120]MDG4810681.1 hypothetical protein [Micromonospora sp. WMMD1120]